MAEALSQERPGEAAPRGNLDAHRARLTRNTTYLTAAFVLQKVLSSGYYLIYANLAGPAAVGSYAFAFSIASVAGVAVDLGLSPLLIREVAKDPAAAPALLRALFRFKLAPAAATLIGLLLLAPVLTRTPLQLELVVWSAVFTVIESFSLTAYGVLRGLQQLKPEALGTTVAQITPLVVGTAGLWVTHDPRWLGLALVSSALTNIGFALTALRRRLGPNWLGQAKRFPWPARTLAPFTLSAVLQRLYAYLDVLLLGWLATSVTVGLYTAAYRFAYAWQFLPIALNTGLYPALSQATRQAPGTLERLAERAFRVLLTFSVPLAALLIVHARPLLATLFPAYRDATLALQITLVSLPALFLNFLLSSLLNATERQSKQTVILAAVVAVNVVGNLLLIPRLAQVGASLAAVAATTLYTVLGGRVAGRSLGLTRQTGGFVLRLLLATALSVAAASLVSRTLHLLLSLAVSAGVSAAGFFLFRVYRLSEFRSLIAAFRRPST